MSKPLYPSEWLKPTVLEWASNNPDWTAQQIAEQMARLDPEFMPPDVVAVQSILDKR
jgi:hypothetical protein